MRRRPCRSKRGNAYQRTDAENNTTTTTYDVLNRVKTTVSAEGVTMTRTYNALGQVVTTTNSLGYTTVKEYDGLGRVVKSWDGAQNLTQMIYDALGNRVEVIDPNGVRTTYLYDQLQRQVGLIQNDTGGSQTVDSNVLSSYQYDVMGNLQVVTSALGISDTVTLYDSLNRPYYTENAVGDGVTTQYDALGYRRVVTDGNDAVTTFGYDGLGRLETTNFLNDGETITVTYNAAGERTRVSNGLGTVSYEYDSLGRMVVVTDTQNARVEYVYDKVGNRTHLTYPPSAGSGQAAKVVTYTYNMDNQLDTVTAWDGGLTEYEYDNLGRLVTMTLPTGITSVGAYDGANRVTGLTHRNGSGVLLGQYEYDLDGVGQPQVVTETLASPTLVTVTEQFLESSGLLVVEAEAGETTAGAGQTWQEQTNQSGYAGDGYLRALPDVGNVWEADDTADTPTAAFPVQVNTTGSYAAWVRGYASDAGGDSLHLTVDGATADSSASVTGFVPDSWTWSRLTMSNTEATLSFPTAGTYDLQLLMREDGMRVDKLLLITDTNYIPTGTGPAASATALITDTVVGSLDTHVVTYAYDDLYRLTEAEFSGAIFGTYQYAYNAVGSRMAYTTTITSTVVTTYTYDAANQLATARSSDTNVLWYYVYDGNGQRVRQVPNSLTPADGEVRYTFNQAGQMIQIENHNGNDYVVQANVGYDGLGQRVLGTTVVEGVPMTVTYTLDGILGQPLVIANNLETTLILYGQHGIGEYKLNAPVGEQWQYYLGDGQLSVRQLTDSDGNVTLTRTYGPYGILLAQAGNGSALFGYAGAQSGAGGLWYFGNGYFDPQTGQFLATGGNPLAPLAANMLANPGSLLFGPLMLISWRKRKKKRLHPATLLFFGVVLAIALTSCVDENGNPISTPTELPPGTQIQLPTNIPPTSTTNPTSTGDGNSIGITKTPCPPTETPTSIPPAETANPTLTPTNTPPPPTSPYTGTSLIVFVEDLISTPVPTPTTDPTPEPTSTPHPNAFTWTENEKAVVNQAADDVAKRLQKTMKDSYGWTVSKNEAFHLVYGPSVTFTKTGWTCQQDTGHKGCWAETQGSNLIYVFTHADIKDSPSQSSYHWATHELGHAFVKAVGSNDPNDTLDMYINGNDALDIAKHPRMGRPPSPEPGEDETEFWGFAGGHYAWQNSWSTQTSEVFADMFTGWVYDTWEVKVSGGLTDEGQDRKEFMDKYMPDWVLEAIDET